MNWDPTPKCFEDSSSENTLYASWQIAFFNDLIVTCFYTRSPHSTIGNIHSKVVIDTDLSLSWMLVLKCCPQNYLAPLVLWILWTVKIQWMNPGHFHMCSLQ